MKLPVPSMEDDGSGLEAEGNSQNAVIGGSWKPGMLGLRPILRSLDVFGQYVRVCAEVFRTLKTSLKTLGSNSHIVIYIIYIYIYYIALNKKGSLAI